MWSWVLSEKNQLQFHLPLITATIPRDTAASWLDPGAAGVQGEALAPHGAMEGLHGKNVLLLSSSVPSWMQSPSNDVVFSQQRRELYRSYLPMGT